MPRYGDERRLGLSDIRDLLARGATLPGFRGFDPELVHDGFFGPSTLESVKGLEGLDGMRLGAVEVEGQVRANDAFDAFREVFRRGGDTVGAEGTLAVRVGFEERESRQTRSGADTAGVWLIRGATHFSYSAGGSRVKRDPGHRRDFFHRLVGAALLPLSLTEAGDDRFRLEHAEGHDLWTSGGGLGGTNPSQIRVATPGRSPSASVETLERFLDTFASAKRFEHAWRAHPAYDGRPLHDMAEGPLILRSVAEAGFPAERYWLHVVFRLARIEEVEVLRSFCGPEDEILLSLGSLQVPPGTGLNLDLVTDIHGHRVRADSKLPVDTGEVAELLGLQLVELG